MGIHTVATKDGEAKMLPNVVIDGFCASSGWTAHPHG
jgi:hypothetical protein